MTTDRPVVAVFDLITSIGGPQKVMAEVLPRLHEDFRVVAIDPYAHPEYAEMLGRLGVEVVGLGPPPARRAIGGKHTPMRIFCLLRRAPWLLRTGLLLGRWIRANRPGVVYFNQLSSVDFFARFIPRRGPALVYHAHGFESARAIPRRCVRLLCRRFARVAAISRVTARSLVEAGVDPAKVIVVHNAVDCEGLEAGSAQPGPSLPARGPDEVVFVHVAVIDPGKAQHLGIEALARLPAGAGASLWICGDVPAEADTSRRGRLLRRARELGVEDRVHFLGWRHDVPRVLRAADVCILPSLVEGFGMALAEAMALGKPCIGARRGGIPEVIEEGVTGLICQPTADSLASAMRTMMESGGLRARMGQAGRRRARQLFNIDRQIHEIRGIIRAAVAAAGRKTLS